MSNISNGMIVIWNDITDEMRDEFIKWHSIEHLPERVSIPGFILGQRWFDADSKPQYLTTYLTQDAHVLTSVLYVQRLNQPTSWTLRSVAAFRNTCRSAGSVIWQIGPAHGYGGYMLAARINEVEDPNQLITHLNALAADKPNVFRNLMRARLVLTTQTASQLPTAERAARTGDLNEPHMILLLEGFSAQAQLENTFLNIAALVPELMHSPRETYSLQSGIAAEKT